MITSGGLRLYTYKSNMQTSISLIADLYNSHKARFLQYLLHEYFLENNQNNLKALYFFLIFNMKKRETERFAHTHNAI